jgi:rfaE bifunctional protein kinase chain/domain
MFEGFDFGAFFSSLENTRVLIIGDVMIDTYLWGKVNRVSPEAPVPIVSDIMEEHRLGGAANVALNVKSLGAIPILCSVIGDDEKGGLFLDLLEEQSLSDVGIIVDDYRVTTQKTRVISGFKHLLRFDEEIDFPMPQRLQDEFLVKAKALMKSGSIDAVIFQDYDKGVVTQQVISELVSLAKKLRIPVMVDPKFRNFEGYEGVSIFKPNMKELTAGLNLEEKNDIERIGDMGDTFRKKMQQDVLMLTMSDKGILVLSDKGVRHLPAHKRKITDVSGAGDTVICVSALCYAKGMDEYQTAAVANLAGGMVCERSGVVPVGREELLEECRKVLGCC